MENFKEVKVRFITIILGSILVLNGCNYFDGDRNNGDQQTTKKNPSITQKSISPYISGDFSVNGQYSLEDQQKVYKDVTLGMSTRKFKSVMPNSVEVIAGYKFRVKTRFDLKGRLMWFQLLALEYQDDQLEGAKKHLFDIVKHKYGDFHYERVDFSVPDDDFISTDEILSNVQAYFWDIGDKKIRVSGIPKYDQGVSGTNRYLVFPTITIFSENLKKEFELDILKEIDKKKRSDAELF